MRQISAEIDQADWLGKFYNRQLVAWQTRMICSWLVKLTPDMAPEQAKAFMQEASEISLDGQESNVRKEAPVRKTFSIPTRKDFYNMDDEEIERYLGQADNPVGSFEQLLGGFGKH